MHAVVERAWVPASELFWTRRVLLVDFSIWVVLEIRVLFIWVPYYIWDLRGTLLYDVRAQNTLPGFAVHAST